MKKQNKNKAKYFVVFIIAFVAIIFLSGNTLAKDKPAINKAEILDNSKIGEYLSPVFDTDFKFNIFGLQLSNETDYLQVRYNDKNGWSGWINPEVLKSKDGQNITEPILADEGEEIQYKINSENISEVKIIYLASDTQEINGIFNIFNWLFSKASAESTLNIISRTSWQADETWRLNSSGAEIWPVEYKWPQKFVIHHTAGSGGGDNPAATVRGIYYWHAVVLGWGDIGYNYIIDQQGNIYEGRYGGEGVVGAHVYRSKTCARERFGDEKLEANFNPGTIGIAVLGDYNNLTLNNTVKNSLTSLIAQKAKEFEIIPSGEGYLIDDTYPNIIGHKDLDCTECPGNNLYKKLEDIRAGAQAKYEILGGVTEKIVKATMVDKFKQPIELKAGEEKDILVHFRNDGNFTWRKYSEESPQVLALSSSTNFNLASIGSSPVVAELNTANVKPGEVGEFILKIKAPEDKLEIKESFVLQFSDDALENTQFTISAVIINLGYAAEYKENNILEATFTDSKHNIIIKIKNKGIKTWKKGDIVLNIYDLDYRKSRYYDSSWPTKDGGFKFQEKEVKPGGIATFSFIMKSPNDIGRYLQILQLKNNDDSIANNEFSTITRVDSPFQAVYISDNIPPALLSTWRYKAEIKFKNTGLSPWHRNVVLNVYDLGDEISRFNDISWVNSYTSCHLQEGEVKPEQIGTFIFYFKSPKTAGLYYNKFKLELSDKEMEVQNGEVQIITRIDK